MTYWTNHLGHIFISTFSRFSITKKLAEPLYLPVDCIPSTEQLWLVLWQRVSVEPKFMTCYYSFPVSSPLLQPLCPETCWDPESGTKSEHFPLGNAVRAQRTCKGTIAVISHQGESSVEGSHGPTGLNLIFSTTYTVTYWYSKRRGIWVNKYWRIEPNTNF